ncbi:MAG: right-handed parallel beta-helix repeat-containing protein [Saprospiraceae bacterium]|nr:right-handed parallel beta-helix repeat-containing protein [Saprospiraceae bacterium]
MRYRFIYPILFLWPLVCSLSATNYYVRSDGNDLNTGLSDPEAFLTIQTAVDLVAAGDTVIVRAGSYAGFDLRGVDGTAASPIVFLAPARDVIIDSRGPIRQDGINIENADYIEVNGFEVVGMTSGGNGIRLVLSNHCTVRNCFCDRNDERGIFTGFTNDVLIENNICSNAVQEHGIYVSNSSDRPIIRFNVCHDNNNIGIHLNGDLSAGGDGLISDAIIYGNIIYDNNQAAGINMDGCIDPVVYNNVIFNNHFAQGIACFQQDGAMVTQGAKIHHNTIVVPSDGRWGILLRDGAHLNTEISNNIVLNLHSWRGCIATEGINMFSSDHNILMDKMSAMGDGSSISLMDWQNLGLDQNSLLAAGPTELFVDYAGGDLRLKDESVAVDQGISLSTPFDVDIRGIPRPQDDGFDIGAHEYWDRRMCLQFHLSENNIDITDTEDSTTLIIEGTVGNYHIQLLDNDGQSLQQIDQAATPITLDMKDICPLAVFLEIRHLSQTGLSIRVKLE